MALIENTIGNTNSGGGIDQDNIDIFRYYYLGGRLSGNIVSTINNGQPFTINEQQSLWIETSSPIPNPNDTFSNLYVTRIYKLIDLGKGIYGLGGNKTVTFNNLKLITETRSTSGDIENLESTQIIDLGWDITGTTISNFVNSVVPPIEFQAQSDGYVLIKVLNNGLPESYLFLGEGGTYGQGELQTTDADFQLLNSQTVVSLQPGDNVSELVNDGDGTSPYVTEERLKNFTTQEINSGGNYNNLEVTADLLVFSNENAQAILNGVWGKKEFHILNLSNTYEVQINHNSISASGNGQPIMLPTNQGTAGIKGTARILFTEGYGYFVADTWGSTYRPEFKNLPSKQVVTVDETSNAETAEIIELIVFRDAQMTPMSKADLNTAYATVFRGFQVICKSINLIYIKVDNNTNDWKQIDLKIVS